MVNFAKLSAEDWRDAAKRSHGPEIPGQIDHDFFAGYALSINEDVSHVREKTDERAMKHPYNMRPLDQYKSQSLYTEKHDAVNLNPLTAGREDRQLWERTVSMAQRKNAWLDRYNADLMTGTDYNGNKVNRKVDAITMNEVRNNPTLARILAGFALQDGESVPFSVQNSVKEKAVAPPAPASPWGNTGIRANNAQPGQVYASLLASIQKPEPGLWHKIKAGFKKLFSGKAA